MPVYKHICSVDCPNNVNSIYRIVEFGSVYPFLFVSYYSKANYVITNTFHGTIFSIIFRKQFIVAATGKKKILELLKKFKLEQRNTDTNMYEKINEEIRYFEVKKILDDYRNESKEFLNKALKE